LQKYIFVTASGGDCCYNCNMMMDAEFEIKGEDGELLGTIQKGDADPMADHRETFGVRFLQSQLTAENKAALLGSVFALVSPIAVISYSR
jgi:hypothetical protein